uniref:RING-type domain-containing protein n=1 Tax=Panagrolaimus superbus TaxID=310955 RepID=A0A914YT52_9BILA
MHCLTRCGHTFHEQCITEWICSGYNSAVCRVGANRGHVVTLYVHTMDQEEAASTQEAEYVQLIAEKKKADEKIEELKKELNDSTEKYYQLEKEFQIFKQSDESNHRGKSSARRGSKRAFVGGDDDDEDQTLDTRKKIKRKSRAVAPRINPADAVQDRPPRDNPADPVQDLPPRDNPADDVVEDPPPLNEADAEGIIWLD